MPKKVVIIGGGPAGYVAALISAKKGLEVILIEEKEIGGTCLNRGCIPLKTLLTSSHLYYKIKEAAKYGIKVEGAYPDLIFMQERKNKVIKTLQNAIEGLLKKRAVRLIKGKGRFLSPYEVEVSGELIKADAVIIATGTEVMRLFEGDGIITSDEALNIKEIPKNFLIIGAGAVGVELACFFSEIGSRVTLVEMLPQILPGFDSEIVEILARELKKKGIIIKLNCKIERIENLKVTFSDDKAESYDFILQAIGRRFNTQNIGLEKIGLILEKGRIKTDNTMQTNIPEIYAAGDIVFGSPMLAHISSLQGMIAALNLAGEKALMDYSVIPNCVYSHPEAAFAGLQEEAVENPQVASIPYRVMGRAHSEGEISGLIKIVAEKETRKLKGIHIIGEKAAEIIHEGALALKFGLTIDKMAEVIRAHPTYSEIYSEALHLLTGNPIHYL
ncbi:MAG: dihydrolipoyl dehydrogenase [Armatimonadetes bacterium]|nr:dihydrolipoyl dehydrogenase [Armatimonadota bacterium]